LIIKGLAEANHFIAALIVTLSGLVVFYSLIKIFLNVFYDNINKQLNLRPLPKSLVFNAITLLVVAIVVGLSSNYLDFFLESSVSTILEPKNYIDIVLKKG
ncbi:sodium:proton antiporter, partial [Streptococcus danieliae]|nr:sodium:proton antiporter [Streptococcus danieliae]